MSERYYQKLKTRFDPDNRVSLALTSRDAELGRYLKAVRARASTRLQADGTIVIQVDDEAGTPTVVWMEEFAHALQLLRSSEVQLSCDDPHNLELEAEVASCLLSRSACRPSFEIPTILKEEFEFKSNWSPSNDNA